ncbi:hypothetical protein SD1617_4867 [Shigella dysenteriae 1617]|nr:hypothetical protein SD1617_4867 [Shigella dysenteriae 1617]
MKKEQMVVSAIASTPHFVVLFTFGPYLPHKTGFLINRLSKRFKLLSHCVAKWAIERKMKL